MTKISRSVGDLDPYLTRETSHRVRTDPRIVDLSFGEPWFGPPPHVVSMLHEFADDPGRMTQLRTYASSAGSTDFQDAVTDRYRRLYGLDITENAAVVATPGGSSAFAAVLLAATDPGARVLIPDPGYMLYERSCRILGRQPVRITRDLDDGYRFDIERLRNLLADDVEALILNSPENPTGYVCSEAEMAMIFAACEDSGATLIHDEVYDDFVFEGCHVPAMKFSHSGNVVQVNSFSKRYGLLGMRLGWVVAPRRLAQAIGRVQDYLSLSVSVLGLDIGARLLADPAMDEWVKERRGELRSRRGIITGAIDESQLLWRHADLPRGGFFVFVDVSELVRELGDGHAAEGRGVDEEAAQILFDDAGVAVTPGSVYGKAGSTSVRMVFSVELAEATRAAERFAGLTG